MSKIDEKIEEIKKRALKYFEEDGVDTRSTAPDSHWDTIEHHAMMRLYNSQPDWATISYRVKFDVHDWTMYPKN